MKTRGELDCEVCGRHVPAGAGQTVPVKGRLKRLCDRTGDCRAMLAGRPERSVHMCVTSPPYWGLRKYAGAQDCVWAAPDLWDCPYPCEGHEWGALERGKRKDILPEGETTLVSRTGCDERQAGAATNGGRFCKHCGAWYGALGLEPTPELYIAHLVECFRAVRRVLRDDGTCWVNIGDSSWGGKGANGTSKALATAKERGYHQNAGTPVMAMRPQDGRHESIKPKDCIGIPWMLAFAMRADGWFWRDTIVWAKGASFCAGWSGSVMPESVRDRCTKSWEAILLFSKSAHYCYDWFAAREGGAASTSAISEGEAAGAAAPSASVVRRSGNKERKFVGLNARGSNVPWAGTQRNWRNVWALGTRGTKLAHYASFPVDLPTKCITAGTMPYVCPECGMPWERVVARTKHPTRDMEAQRAAASEATGRSDGHIPGPSGMVDETGMTGWRTTCGCYDGWYRENSPRTQSARKLWQQDRADWWWFRARRRPIRQHEVPKARAIVLDPFAGTGTTGQAAELLGRDALLVELAPQYVELCRKRMKPLVVADGPAVAKAMAGARSMRRAEGGHMDSMDGGIR